MISKVFGNAYLYYGPSVTGRSFYSLALMWNDIEQITGKAHPTTEYADAILIVFRKNKFPVISRYKMNWKEFWGLKKKR